MVTHPQHVVVWEWEVVRGEVELELLRPTGSAEGIGVDTGGVEGYECLREPQLCRSGEVSLVSTFKCGGHFVCIQHICTYGLCNCRGVTSVPVQSFWPYTGQYLPRPLLPPLCFVTRSLVHRTTGDHICMTILKNMMTSSPLQKRILSATMRMLS